MAKFCKNCGNPLKEGAKFCARCGATTGNQESGSPAGVQPFPAPEKDINAVNDSRGEGIKKHLPVIISVVISVIIVIELLVAMFVFPGWLKKDKAGTINTAEVLIPYPTGQEAVVNSTLGLALHYRMVAQAYHDELIAYDFKKGSVEEYSALLNDTIKAYENLENVSEGLSIATDKWMNTNDEDSRKTPVVVAYTMEPTESGLEPFIYNAYAAPDSEALKWAKEITEKYDKAPVGKGVKTLAEQLNTDAKHAYAELKKAQAIIEGAAYSDLAEVENTCYKIAITAKTAGTVAGFLAGAGAVEGAVSATALGVAEGVCTAGGVVMGGVSSILQIGSTASTLIHNGEDNRVSTALDGIESFYAPVATVLTIGGGISNINNIVNNSMEASTYMGRLLSEDGLSVVCTALDLLNNDLITEGLIVGVSAEKASDGIKLIIRDTKTGSGKDEIKAMKELLISCGLDPKEAEEVVNRAADNIDGIKEPTPLFIDDSIPENMIEEIKSYNDGFLPEQDNIDTSELKEELEVFDGGTGETGSGDGKEPSGKEDDNGKSDDGGLLGGLFGSESDEDSGYEDGSGYESQDTEDDEESAGKEMLPPFTDDWFSAKQRTDGGISLKYADDFSNRGSEIPNVGDLIVPALKNAKGVISRKGEVTITGSGPFHDSDSYDSGQTTERDESNYSTSISIKGKIDPYDPYAGYDCDVTIKIEGNSSHYEKFSPSWGTVVDESDTHSVTQLKGKGRISINPLSDKEDAYRLYVNAATSGQDKWTQTKKHSGSNGSTDKTTTISDTEEMHLNFDTSFDLVK